MKEFCEKYGKEIALPYSINGRIDTITEEMLNDLSKSGCSRIGIGIESGDPKIRKDVLKRNITDKQIIDGCRLIKKYGLELYTYNIIGIPGESIQHIKKTLALNSRVRPDYLMASIFSAYKGTELYETCKKKGLLRDEMPTNSFYTGSNVKHPSLSPRRLRHIRKWFGFYVFVTYDIKRAFIELLDRYLMMNRFYSRFRSLCANKVMHYLKARKELN